MCHHGGEELRTSASSDPEAATTVDDDDDDDDDDDGDVGGDNCESKRNVNVSLRARRPTKDRPLAVRLRS